MLKSVILSLLTFISLTVLAQPGGGNSSGTSSNSVNQLIVYPSPTASSIAVRASSNVDLYTGRASLTIPIYTLKSRTLAVPISLQYSSTGAKPDETAGWV